MKPRNWSHMGSMGRTCIQDKETDLERLQSVDTKRCNCTKNQRVLTHLMNAGNEVMGKTLHKIKLHRFVKVLSACLTGCNHSSPGCGRQPLVRVPLSCHSVTPWCFFFPCCSYSKVCEVLDCIKELPKPLTACPSLISMDSKPPRAATMHTIPNPSKITWLHFFFFFMADAFVSNWSITSDHKVSGGKTKQSK